MNDNYRDREAFYKNDSRSFCEVCGDKARGCNFDAITCASCKEFFRRNAFKEKGLKCYFQGNCTIDVVSRRFCASCRLRKCFEAGMKKEYIMSDEERYARKAKIIEKKQIKDSLKSDSFLDNDFQRKLDLMSYSSTNLYKSIEHSIIQTITTDDSCPSPLMASRGIGSPDLPIGSLVSQDSDAFGFDEPPLFSPNYLNGSIRMSNTESELNGKLTKDKNEKQNASPLATDFETITKLLSKVKIIRESNYYPTKYALLCRANNTKKQLTPIDKYKLKHLTSNVQLMQAETIHELPTSERFIDVVKITEIITHMLIKMCKKLTAFQTLTRDDQIALVKGSCMETLIIRSIMTINLEKECWESMDLERNFKFSLKMEVLKQANLKLYEAHRKYALSFEPEWRFDDNLMSLLIAITLFTPDRPNLINLEAIQAEQQCYINLLKHYLETIYDEGVAETIFYKLMAQLKFTRSISEIHVKAYFDVNTSEIKQHGIGGLLMEIFDLNA